MRHKVKTFWMKLEGLSRGVASHRWLFALLKMHKGRRGRINQTLFQAGSNDDLDQDEVVTCVVIGSPNLDILKIELTGYTDVIDRIYTDGWNI